jgi:hypothetical protein
MLTAAASQVAPCVEAVRGQLPPMRLACIVLILGGVIGLKLVSAD